MPKSLHVKASNKKKDLVLCSKSSCRCLVWIFEYRFTSMSKLSSTTAQPPAGCCFKQIDPPTFFLCSAPWVWTRVTRRDERGREGTRGCKRGLEVTRGATRRRSSGWRGRGRATSPPRITPHCHCTQLHHSRLGESPQTMHPCGGLVGAVRWWQGRKCQRAVWPASPSLSCN